MYEFYSEDNLKFENPNKRRIKRLVIWVVCLGIIIFLISLISPPKDFPAGKIITIKSGSTLNDVSRNFFESKIIKSPGIFESVIVLLEGDKSISAGDYLFVRPTNVLEVARMIVTGDYGIKKVSVTLPEGFTVNEMAKTLGAKLSEFNEEEFLFLTKNSEGYLFPDTYFFFPTTSAKDVVKMLEQTFDQKVNQGLKEELEKSDKSFEDIIIMASIIQAEAYDHYEEKQIISGILWKRLQKGMLLQVDATLGYVNGKSSAKLTIEDLAENQPYNTYVHKGLPPAPIGNPGVSSIKAALNPKDSPYFFYLHDKNGNVHYAKTFEEHKQNIALYLK
ncbi:MAG: endolytic transglycosylase MltG [Bacteroidetes bacterium]|nr:endolytic transglycosylase MltG [Bacteroidota bacterium]